MSSLAEEVPHMPTKSEILAKALELFHKANPEAPTPEEDELKEGNWFEQARRELMSGLKSQLEGYLAFLEQEAESIRGELGVKPAPPPKEVRELEEQIDIVSSRLQETKTRLREAKRDIERLRAVKIPPKVVAPPPKKPVCPAHNVELVRLPEKKVVEGEWVPVPQPFPFGDIVVPEETFLYQCPIESEYYICEPRKRCELISLNKLKLKLARIIKPIVVRPPRRERARIIEPAELEPDFNDFIRETGITMEDYRRLDMLAKFVMRSEYRRWKARPY